MLSPTTSQSWDYDSVGNWDSITTNSTTQTRTANKQNEITAVSGATTPNYDSNGNLTTDENNYRFIYDAWNKVVQVKNSSNVVIVTYGRDALHRHVTDTVSSTVTDRFFSSDWQLLETKTGSNTVTRNVWSPVYVDGLVLRDRDTDSNGTLDERLYSMQDANWNTTALVNTSGTVQERYTYTPFGQVTFRDSSGSTLSNSAKDWIFLHQGGERIAAGDYEFRNRVYSPSLGRWLSNDPLGFDAGDSNLYRNINNNPLNFIDPLGLFFFTRPGGTKPQIPSNRIGGYENGNGALGGSIGGLAGSPPGGYPGYTYPTLRPSIPAFPVFPNGGEGGSGCVGGGGCYRPIKEKKPWDPGGYPGGYLNPLNWPRWFWTGDPNAPENVYEAALEEYSKFLICWWECEVKIHKDELNSFVSTCAGLQSLIVFGGYYKILKDPKNFIDGSSIYTTLYSKFTLDLFKSEWRKESYVIRVLHRKMRDLEIYGKTGPWKTGLKMGGVSILLLEGFGSISCGMKCK